MPTITTFLAFERGAEEAARFYVSLFPDSRIVEVIRYGAEAPAPEGSVMTVVFELLGRTYVALNGGPHFRFSDGISLAVSCDTQEEIDHYWERLTDGGEPGPCGWLRDRFGVSWQVNPARIERLLGAGTAEQRGRVMQAMMGMRKLDVAALERAYQGS